MIGPHLLLLHFFYQCTSVHCALLTTFSRRHDPVCALLRLSAEIVLNKLHLVHFNGASLCTTVYI